MEGENVNQSKPAYEKPFDCNPDKKSVQKKLAGIRDVMDIFEYERLKREYTSAIESKYPRSEYSKYKLFNAVTGNSLEENEPELDFPSPDSVMEFVKRLDAESKKRELHLLKKTLR